MPRYVPSRSPCPVGRAARLLGDHWVLLIVREAFLGVERFDGFVDRLGISRAALTSRLQWLVDGGILARDPAVGKRARYRLTLAGQALRPVFADLIEWGERWLPIDAGPGN